MEIFKRVEEKYLLTEKEKKLLINKINKYIMKDEYYISHIYNIYYDTINYDLIINSLEKPIFKDKFRIRSYDLNSNEVFIEMKVKYKGVVGKRRIKLKLNEFNKYLNGKETNNQILKEIIYYFKYYNLKPSIYIAYDRESFKGITDKGLRITFDSNLRSRKDNISLSDNNTKNYFQDNTYIMEIKTLGSMPLWLVHTLSELKIYPTSFSKYGKIYEKEMVKYA